MSAYHSLFETQNAIKAGKTTCVEVVKSYLDNISKRNSQINAFIEVFEKESLRRAEIIDQKILNGKFGKLAGMVIAVKDNICIKGFKVTASSRMLNDFHSLYNATSIQRILDEDGIVLGRLNCDEFAMGSSNENSVYGPVKNPLDITKVPGGSSGGCAAAVAANFCLAALGSDTGGSIRQPSSFCGVVGLKPTYSRVSRYGLIAYASSFDQIGPITKNISDADLIMQVISGKDPNDSTSSSKKYNARKKDRSNYKYKIGFLKESLSIDGIDAEVKESFIKTINSLKKNGHEVKEISFPYFDYMIPIYYVLSTAEASSNLARFDGVHYGYRSNHSKDLEDTYVFSRSEGFGEEVKRRIMLGTFVLSAGYKEDYYRKAQKIRRVIFEETEDIFKSTDFILSPTTPHTAFDLGVKQTDPTKMYLEDIFTVHANITGNPSISIPLYKHSNKMPFSLQISSQNFQEEKLINFASEMMSKI